MRKQEVFDVVTDGDGLSEPASTVHLQQYPMKCEAIEQSMWSSDNSLQHHQQRVAGATVLLAGSVPSTVAILTNQSLLLQAHNVLSQRQDAIAVAAAAAAAAAGRNITPVKCMISLIQC